MLSVYLKLAVLIIGVAHCVNASPIPKPLLAHTKHQKVNEILHKGGAAHRRLQVSASPVATPTATATPSAVPHNYLWDEIYINGQITRPREEGQVLLENAFIARLDVVNAYGTVGNQLRDFHEWPAQVRTNADLTGQQFGRLSSTYFYDPATETDIGVVFAAGYLNSSTEYEPYPTGITPYIQTLSEGGTSATNVGAMPFDTINVFTTWENTYFTTPEGIRYCSPPTLYPADLSSCTSTYYLTFTNMPTIVNFTYGFHDLNGEPVGVLYSDSIYSIARGGEVYPVAARMVTARPDNGPGIITYSETAGFQSVTFDPLTITDFTVTGSTSRIVPGLKDFTLNGYGLFYLTTEGNIYHVMRQPNSLEIELPGYLVYQAGTYMDQPFSIGGIDFVIIESIPSPSITATATPTATATMSVSPSATSTASVGASATPTPTASITASPTPLYSNVGVVLSAYKPRDTNEGNVLIQESYYAELYIRNTNGPLGNTLSYTADEVGCRTDLEGSSNCRIVTAPNGTYVSRIGYYNDTYDRPFPYGLDQRVSTYYGNGIKSSHELGSGYNDLVTGFVFTHTEEYPDNTTDILDINLFIREGGFYGCDSPNCLTPHPLYFKNQQFPSNFTTMFAMNEVVITPFPHALAVIHYGDTLYSFGVDLEMFEVSRFLVTGKRYNDTVAWVYGEENGFQTVNITFNYDTFANSEVSVNSFIVIDPENAIVPGLIDFEVLPNGNLVYLTSDSKVYYAVVTESDTLTPTISLPGTLINEAATLDGEQLVYAGVANIPNFIPGPVVSPSSTPSPSASASASATPITPATPTATATPGPEPAYDIVFSMTTEVDAPKKDGQYYPAESSLVRLKVFNPAGPSGNVPEIIPIPLFDDLTFSFFSKYNRDTNSFNRIANSWDFTQVIVPAYLNQGGPINGLLGVSLSYNYASEWNYKFTGFLDGMSRMTATVNADAIVFVATTDYVGTCEIGNDDLECRQVTFVNEDTDGVLNYTTLFFMGETEADLVAIQNKKGLSTFSHNHTSYEVSPKLIAGKSNHNQYAWVYGLVNGFETVDISNGYATASFRVSPGASRIIPNLKDFIILPDQNIIYLTTEGEVVFVEVTDTITSNPHLHLPGTVIHTVPVGSVYGGLALFPTPALRQ